MEYLWSKKKKIGPQQQKEEQSPLVLAAELNVCVVTRR